jgi:hypothetical protein
MFAGRSVDSPFTSNLVVSAFAPKPVNSLLIGPKMRVAELAGQLVGAVDQVDLHRSERYHFAALVFSAEQELAASRGREDWARALRTGKV